MNINITALCGLTEGVNAVLNGRKFDHVNQSNRRIFINCIRMEIYALTCDFDIFDLIVIEF